MKILIANQKGGAGKSTVTLLLALYLTKDRGRRATLIDLDLQRSVTSKVQTAKVLENPVMFPVISSTVPNFLEQLAEYHNNEDLVLIDWSGVLAGADLAQVFTSADLLICPFAYDEFTVHSTLLFAIVFRKLNQKANLVFLPNRIKQTADFESRASVEKTFLEFGVVLPGLTDRVDFQRITATHIPDALHAIILPVLDLLYENYIAPNRCR